jgi:N-acyl-D-aspartate/D-glutamate deacylase
MKSSLNRREFIRMSTQAGVILGLGTSFGTGKLFASPAGFDLLIKNGTVVDGLSDKTFRADVGIVGDRIQAIGDLGPAQARLVIEATGRAVSPGFVDIHAHSDAIELLVNPKCESKIRQGVTLEVSGNCGGSSFPFKKEVSETEKRYSERYHVERDWTDLAGYLARVQKTGVAFNYVTLVGQGTVREYAMNEDRRKPTAAELELMQKLVAQAMEQGAFGISTGLEYTPSGFASTEEVIELARVAAKYGGIYATHVRSEDIFVIEAVAEAIHIAETASLPLQISHFKSCGTINWWKMPTLFSLVEVAAQRGVAVTVDRYPYTAYSTGLSVNFPQSALAGGNEAFVKLLQDPVERSNLRDETMQKLDGTPWENILLTDLDAEDDKRFIGKTLEQAADELGQDPYEFMCDILVKEKGNVGYIGFGMSEEQTEQILKHPLAMLCSDGSALAPYGPLHQGKPHPRNYGTFPRFLGVYVRERKALSLPQAVKKMAALPAAKLGIKDRGTLKQGNFADIVVFDPATVADKATYIEPEQYPVGIDYVIVNGQVVVDHDKHTGVLPGKILYGPGKK